MNRRLPTSLLSIVQLKDIVSFLRYSEGEVNVEGKKISITLSMTLNVITRHFVVYNPVNKMPFCKLVEILVERILYVEN